MRNGHKIVSIMKTMVPRSIKVLDHRIRIMKILPAGTCVACLVDGHRAAECGGRAEGGDDADLEEEKSGEEESDEGKSQGERQEEDKKKVPMEQGKKEPRPKRTANRKNSTKMQ